MKEQSLNKIHFNFYSDVELLQQINEQNLSLARFGDGEIGIILDRAPPTFQNYHAELRERLHQIIHSDHPKIRIGIPLYFNDTSMLHFYSKSYWDTYIAKNIDFIQTLNKERTYANTGVTRPYIDLADRSGSKSIFELFNILWKDKNVLIVEGKKSRFGVNNDLLNDVKQVHRILCPETNAYSYYDEIKDAVLKTAENYDIILVALGPTATVLCYDLGLLNKQAIDIGHLDIEYEWYLKKAIWKVQINNKYVNEAKSGNPYVETATLDSSYYESIICEINSISAE